MTQHPNIPTIFSEYDITIRRMDAADFVFLDWDYWPTGIERCEITNFIQKLRDGELESQMVKCDEQYMRIILLLEGVFGDYRGNLATYKFRDNKYVRSHVYENTPYSYATASIVALSDMGVEFIQTPNFACSMQVVKNLYDVLTTPEPERTLFKKIRPIKIPVKLSANPAVPKLMSLCSRFPEKVAIRLINKYDSIWNILHTPEEELLEIDGFGKGLLAKLKIGVGKN